MSLSTTLGFSYIEEFRCLADQCKDNCCGSWRLALNPHTALSYREDYPALYDIIAKDNMGYYMQQNDNGCLAQDDGLCLIHRDYNESLLSDTCMNYPRLYRSLEPIYVRSGTMSCPEVARKCLFDDDPFSLQETTLPKNHQEGLNLPKTEIAGLNQTLWTKVVSELINSILEEDTPLEHTMSMLLSLASSLDSNDMAYWPDLISDSRKIDYYPSTHVEPDTHVRAKKTTDLLFVLLEHLDHPSGSDAIRQNVLRAFSVISHDENQRPLCQLKTEFKRYYEINDTGWLIRILKRFMAAEMSRNGFPFLSHTPMGLDYGESLEAWATTLCIRTLSLRLLLITAAANCAGSDTTFAPEQKDLVEWVYRFCRKTNHTPTGPNELDLRQNVLGAEGNRLREYFDVY